MLAVGPERGEPAPPELGLSASRNCARRVSVGVSNTIDERAAGKVRPGDPRHDSTEEAAPKLDESIVADVDGVVPVEPAPHSDVVARLEWLRERRMGTNERVVHQDAPSRPAAVPTDRRLLFVAIA